MCSVGEHIRSMFIIQISTWLWILAMQWTLCCRKIYYSFSVVGICTCGEWCFQEPNPMKCFVKCHGRIQGDIRLTRNPWGVDVVQIHVQKPKVQCFVVNDYSFKSKEYNMQLQTIVDPKKQFLDVFVEMPSSLIVAWVL